MTSNEDKEMLKECQQWKNSLNIRIGFQKEFVDKFKELRPKEEIKSFRIVGLIDRDRWNMYEGYRIENKVYHHCLFRIYHPMQMNEVMNEVTTYSIINNKLPKNSKDFFYQKLISIGFSEESQTFVLCLDYCYLMNFSDFNYALHILPEDIRDKIILKIAQSLKRTLKIMHKKLGLVHRKISAETVIFNLDSNPIITDFSNVYPKTNEYVIKDKRDLGILIKNINDFKISKSKNANEDDENKDEDDYEEDKEEEQENNEEQKDEHMIISTNIDFNKDKENDEKAKKQKIEDIPKYKIKNDIKKFIDKHLKYDINENFFDEYDSDS